MNIPLQANKSLQQLPLITKKSGKYSSPLIEKMKSLHSTNIKTIRKHQTQSANSLQKYFNNKKQYLQIVYAKKQSNVQKALKNLDNKSELHFKENAEKLIKHNQLYQSLTMLKQDKTRTNYLKEKAKQQSAFFRKQEFDRSRYKQVLVKKPNYGKMYLQELGKSQQLHKTTIQRLIQASNRRKQKQLERQRKTKGKLDQTIHHAQQYAFNLEMKKENKFIEKSIQKMQKSQSLMKQHYEKSRSASQTSRKSIHQKYSKAQHKRIQIEQQTIEKLERILQEKTRKIETTIERRSRNLESLAETLKKSRSKLMKQAQQRSRSLNLENELRSSVLMHENHEKWKFLTGIKTEFEKVRNKNLYDSQQVSLGYQERNQ